MLTIYRSTEQLKSVADASNIAFVVMAEAGTKRVIELGAFSVVVGSIITRPQLITKSFAQALD